MPLQEGSSKEVISSNIKELLNSNKGDKKIGHTKKDMSPAEKRKQAIAIAFNKAKENYYKK